MLISCDDLRKLRVIPADFPNAVLTVKSTNKLASLKPKLLRKFDRTLSDDLNPQPMKCSSMSISLQEDAIPICVTTARRGRVPKYYESESKKTVDELLERQVIAPVEEPTTWCSPAFFVPTAAFFVPKADGKSVRLVTDFTALNKFVKRPTHPFPSTHEIIEAIPPDAKLFCKLDAVHGYFQLALDERSSRLTTFLILQGRFRYLRAPMGLNASSDEWCRQSDIIIRGLPFAMKIVDDTIIWAKDEKELEDRVETVLKRCEENNITISRKKLELGDSIHFAGHIISDRGICPDDEKFAALRNFQQPCNLKELRSFPGLVAHSPQTRHA